MAGINGIILKKLRKVRTKDKVLLYKGELYIGDTKIADWSETDGDKDILHAEQGFERRKIIHHIRKYDTKHTFEEIMYLLGTLSEDEYYFKKARKEGYSGLVIIDNSKRFIGKYLSKEDLFKTDTEIEEMIQEELKELAVYSEEIPTYKIYRNFSDFMFGKPVALESVLED